ncbi:helix-turn-helix transcriptional regulator [Crocosphaera chwakensis]|uniref:Prophage CP4-57 regulatory n=1 Tax=Crocosphaera chwakensis CCY0110 TaxID=391612 RepID=A3ILT2_9CHRO|nr:hypothetical protein [Crocosphaera chwakensis]EAZ92733.1 Prophage CP4-57 regulatory [Crocosphaera chwakensis CCY0110]
MGEYEFTLKFELPDQNIDPEIYIDQLYEPGCDDALIGIGKKGYIALDFIRESETAYLVVSSAMEDVLKVIPQANILEVAPDFVGITDIAKLLGCTRQNIQKLIPKDNAKCPHAVYRGSQSIWHLADILTWLVENKDYQIEESLIEIAQTTRHLNLAKQINKLSPNWEEQFKTLVGYQ